MTKLTDREHEVATNVWGEDTPIDLREIDNDQLVTMHDRASKAVQASYDDDDIESLGILLPLERKILDVLYQRL